MLGHSSPQFVCATYAGVLAATAAFAAFAVPAQAAPATALQGVVTEVIDGNTLVFTPAGQAPLTVRLRDVEAPLSCQPWGAEAQSALAGVALSKPATLRPGGRDARGRVLGAVRIDGELELGPWLVEEGHAWSRRTRFDQGPLVKQERVAHALGRGLHATAGAVPPAVWRQAHGPCPDPAMVPIKH